MKNSLTGRMVRLVLRRVRSADQERNLLDGGKAGVKVWVQAELRDEPVNPDRRRVAPGLRAHSQGGGTGPVGGLRRFLLFPVHLEYALDIFFLFLRWGQRS